MLMLSNYRGIALVSLLLVGTAVAAGGTYLMQAPAKPDPQTADRAEIFRYLVVGDLALDSAEYQVAMVDRVTVEFAGSASLPEGAAEQIPDSYRSQFDANLATLKRVWFRSRGLQYHNLPKAERDAFLDKQINAVLDWSRVDLQLSSDTDTRSPDERRAAYAAEFFTEIEVWIAEAEGEESKLLSATVRDGIIRWLATRSLNEEPLGTRQQLATRIVDELDAGLKLNEVIDSLPDEEQTQLSANSLLLIEAWLHELAIVYEQLPVARREAFLDKHLDRVIGWDLANVISQQSTSDTTSATPLGSLQMSLRLFATIASWIERADETSRPRFQAFMTDIQKEWMARQMGGR